jgi:hypothetical protein
VVTAGADQRRVGDVVADQDGLLGRGDVLHGVRCPGHFDVSPEVGQPTRDFLSDQVRHPAVGEPPLAPVLQGLLVEVLLGDLLPDLVDRPLR